MAYKIRALVLALLCALTLTACAGETAPEETNGEGNNTVTTGDDKTIEIQENLARKIDDFTVRVYNITQDTIMVGVEHRDADDPGSVEIDSSEMRISETTEILGLQIELLEINKGAPADKPGATNSSALLRIEG